MVNSKKKISKQSIAIIVLSLLLVLSMVLALSGAWFTDIKSNSEVTVNMGTIDIQGSTGAITVTKDDTVAMPGDTIELSGNIINSGTGKAWVRYKVSHTYTTDDALKTALDAAFTGKYVYVESVVAADGSEELSETITIPTTLGNAAQDASFGLTLTMEALQWANTADTCEAAFAEAGYADIAVEAA